jgi:hypothetical protein
MSRNISMNVEIKMDDEPAENLIHHAISPQP